jgi:hypothetical protein
MNEDMSDLPQAIAADPDGVQVALRAAHTLWSRGDTAESLKWLRKAAESASDEGADVRSLQLAKAAAELRGRLVGGSEPPARSALAGSALSGAAANAAIQQTASFPPGDAAPGESGSHPIAPSRARSDSEPPRESFAGGASSEEMSGALSSRPVTATQYPSHRPRQRIGLLSASPASTRDSGAYASVPSWSADSERRGSGAPPPLPQASLDDYEELEAEPDDEPADDPGSVWSSGGPESWRPAEARGISSGATPPPLPTGGAFADDDNEFTQQTEAQTGALPPLQEQPGAEPRSTRDARHAVGFGLQGNAWDQQSRVPSWAHDTGSPWGAEAHQSSWGSAHSPESTHLEDGASQDELLPEGAPSSEASEASRAKLTARVHHQAVRVSFAPDLRVPGQYLVRPLREGEKAATGERVALLVALEPGVPLV